MYRNKLTFILVIAAIMVSHTQDSTKVDLPIKPKIDGYHAGVVQILFSHNNGETVFFDRTSVYSVGFPFGITLNTSGKIKIDLELVPFINPIYIF
jgi:hypothetical protein